MSTTESSGASTEGTAATPAPAAEFPTFGSTRGSGLARGKRASAASASSSTPPASDYKPTAIEVVSAPREYTNPFAPAETPVTEAAPAPVAEAAPVIQPATPAPAPVAEAAPVAPAIEQPAAAPAQAEAPAELNILPPAEQRTAPAQTWESEGFSPARESRRERAPREEQPEEVDIASIPPQFLYVREGVKYVPTPKNWGGAPRERRPAAESPAAAAPAAESPSQAPAAPAKSGGILGWFKGLFGGSSASAEPAATAGGEQRREGGHRRHRGGRGRGSEGGGQRRHRGGRGRNRGYGESEGTRNSGSL